eukprot:gene2518-3033_t
MHKAHDSAILEFLPSGRRSELLTTFTTSRKVLMTATSKLAKLKDPSWVVMARDQSRLVGKENAVKIGEYISRGDNVIILSNHQTECDPQVLSILLEREDESLGKLAESIIFVAGHKVTNDPVAIPFSMAFGKLAAEGGKVFWVAPSGGRDRPSEPGGEFVVSPFDVKALDMFKIIAMQSKRAMHFFPMAMYSNRLVPPPATLSSTLGETRSAKRGPVSVAFLDETDGLGGLKDKEFAASVQRKVEEAYSSLVDWHRDKEGFQEQ